MEESSLLYRILKYWSGSATHVNSKVLLGVFLCADISDMAEAAHEPSQGASNSPNNLFGKREEGQGLNKKARGFLVMASVISLQGGHMESEIPKSL